MFIEKIRNNGKDYLRLVHAVRKPNKNGESVSTKKVILNIGPLDRFDDGQPDFLARLKQSFKAGDSLIPALKPYCMDSIRTMFTIPLTLFPPTRIRSSAGSTPTWLKKLAAPLR